MTRGKQHYKENIYDNAYATFFVATNTAMLDYPYIVGRYDQSTPTHAKQAEEYILDSAIGDPSVGNEDVLDRATDIGADSVVAADIKGDTLQTTENIIEMIEMEREREEDFEVLIPLQYDTFSTHVDHYENVKGAMSDISEDIEDYRLYVGGINKKSADEQIRRCVNLREHVGLDQYIHGLGMGAHRKWIVTIRRCPWLLDSFDNSSIVQNLIKSGKLWTVDADWVPFDRPRGTNSTVVSVQYREASLDLFNYMIGSDIREEDAIESFADADSDIAGFVSDHEQWYQNQTVSGDSAAEVIAD